MFSSSQLIMGFKKCLSCATEKQSYQHSTHTNLIPCIRTLAGICHLPDMVSRRVKPFDQLQHAPVITTSSMELPLPSSTQRAAQVFTRFACFSAPLFQFGSRENTVIKLHLSFFITPINCSFKSFILQSPESAGPGPGRYLSE